MNKIILASASPRRRELLTQIGLDFTVCVSTCEEKITKSIPSEVVCELSAQKAIDVWKKTADRLTGNRAEAVLADPLSENRIETAGTLQGDLSDTLVIGADTVVAYNGKIMGKPADENEAVAMLTALSGNTHEVYTGVTICYREEGIQKVNTFYERTAVTFYPMSREEIESYVASKEPMDKAGSYGIQGSFAAYVKSVEGDYNNVVGLPVGRLYQEIKELLYR